MTKPEFMDADLSGARFQKVRLNDASFRMVDLSGAVLRDISLSGATIDGAEMDGLVINGVEVAPLVEAELVRRVPARALRRSKDPAGLQEAWALLGHSWAAVYERVESLPAGSVHISVAGEWSFAHTLRHLIFATDAWLGAIKGERRPFHPWGTPFSDVGEFTDGAETLGIDLTATPTYREILDLRADRVAKVSQFLHEVDEDGLASEVEGPVWEHGERLSVVRCVWVILNEECEHLRFATRDLDAIAAGIPPTHGD